MATSYELTERLLKRFKGVPNFDLSDAAGLIDEALAVHGFSASATIPASKENLILLYAQAEGAFQIALATAHYFQYRDGEESVNKATISEQYRKLAKDLRAEYERKRAEASSKVVYMKRVDR